MKITILAGIAVCVLLLTSPVLASAGYSKIYGNANEDDVLDMRDVTYIKLVIFGKKPATALSDANYDGKISMLDIGQTKLIILGKEKELTLIDMADRIVTIPRPIERIVSLFPEQTRVILQVGAVDKIVGISSYLKYTKYAPGMICTKAYPELAELPCVGMYSDPNMELILSLKPDVVFSGYSPSVADTVHENTGIPIVCAKCSLTDPTVIAFSNPFEAFRLVGKVIGKEKEADELISYANEKIDEITEVTLKIPDSEKTTVYLAHWKGMLTGAATRYDPIDAAGGMNIAKGCDPTLGSGMAEVSKEQIILWNPDIILIKGTGKVNDLFPEDVLTDPDLQTVNAVKNGKVYFTRGGWLGYDLPVGVAENAYLAKLFYPDKFKDLEVEKECNEILERFYGVDGLFTWLSEFYEFELHPKPWK